MTDQLTLFAADIHASLSPQPGSDEARKMTATSGQNLIGSWLNSGPLGSLERMLLGTSAWASMTCFLTWRDKVTPAERLLFQLAPLTPRTDETEFGLWPTARAADGKGAVNPSAAQKSVERGFSPNLPEVVTAQNAGLWPTPRSCSAMTANITRKTAQRTMGNLEERVAKTLWPTPTTRDYKGGRKPEALEASGRGATNSLNDALTCQGQHGSLNPTWVEWLMGFPEGWTDLKPSEMPLSRKSPK